MAWPGKDHGPVTEYPTGGKVSTSHVKQSECTHVASIKESLHELDLYQGLQGPPAPCGVY